MSDDAQFWRDLLAAMTREIDDGEYGQPWRGTENAPGHAHDVPGVWDADNGSKAGKPCAWCMTWNRARAALAASPAQAIPAVDPVAIIEQCAVRAATHSQYPVETDFDHGYAKARRDAAHSIRALKAASAISESDMLRHRALAAEARCDHIIKILTRIHGFLLPNDVRLPDGRVFEFNNPKVEHEMLRGLRDAIRAVPDEIAAIDAARKGGKS